MERKGKIAAVAIITYFLISVFLASFSFQGSSEQILVETKMETSDTPELVIGNQPIMGEDGNGYYREQKEVPMELNSVMLEPFVNGTVYPNTPVTLKITYSSISPKNLYVFLDNNDMTSYLKYDVRSNSLSGYGNIENMVYLDMISVDTEINNSNGNWETEISLLFSWEMPGDLQYQLKVVLEDTNGMTDEMFMLNGYVLEKDLRIKGEPVIIPDEDGRITPDLFLKGGSFITVSNLMVSFEGTNLFYPDPNDIELGVTDGDERRWDYKPMVRDELENLNFRFRVPRVDEEIDFEFRIFKAPLSSEVDGEGYFSYSIDSTSPKIGAVSSELDDQNVMIEMVVDEQGSGEDISSLQYRLLDNQERQLRDWSHPQKKITDDPKVSFQIKDLEISDYNIEVRISDRVGNKMEKPKSFFFSTKPDNYHDIAIVNKPTASMDPIIENTMVHFKTVVENLGNVDESDVPVEIFADDEVYLRTTIPNLPAGTTREFSWEWLSNRNVDNFHVILDPLERIDETDRSDNLVTVPISTEYRDLTARSDYIIPSSWDSDIGQVISLSFIIKNTGSISSGRFKVQVYEDDIFIGQYQMPSISPDGSTELLVDWIVDENVKSFVISVDHFNEIAESVEGNNIAEIENPYFVPQVDDEGKQPSAGNDPDEEVETTTGKEEEIMENIEGETIFTGPEEESDEEAHQSGSIPIPGENNDLDPPPDPSNSDLMPIVLPTAMVTMTFLGLTGIFAGLRIEGIRYKWVGLLIPLYSKLKKSKIEKGIRYEILGYLKARPGANYSELKKNLDLNDGTLVHHLRVLERAEKIYSKKMGKYKLFYASSYKRQAAIDDYLSPFHKRILEIIRSNPGIIPKKLSIMLDRSQTDISYHLSELTRSGFLDKRKKGRNNHYYINNELMELLSS